MADLSNRSFFSSSHGLRTSVLSFCYFASRSGFATYVERVSGEDRERWRNVVEGKKEMLTRCCYTIFNHRLFFQSHPTRYHLGLDLCSISPIRFRP